MINRFTICFIFSIIFPGICLSTGDDITLDIDRAGMHKTLTKIFVPENLYEYINGAAESYLSYEFQELVVQNYEDNQNQTVIVEIYRHNNPVSAFGIYSQERPLQSNFLNIGSQAYYEEGILNFLKGCYYVKLSTLDFENQDQSILEEFAEQIDQQLKGDRNLPGSLSWFPGEGKIENSEKFISQNFLGYSVLKNVFTADYEVSNYKFSLFLLEAPSQGESRNILESYVSSAIGVKQDKEENYYTVNDPYQGIIGLLWKNRFILGTINLEPADMRSNYLKMFEKEIEF